jgi:hypothetical protein
VLLNLHLIEEDNFKTISLVMAALYRAIAEAMVIHLDFLIMHLALPFYHPLISKKRGIHSSLLLLIAFIHILLLPVLLSDPVSTCRRALQLHSGDTLNLEVLL